MLLMRRFLELDTSYDAVGADSTFDSVSTIASELIFFQEQFYLGH